MRFVVPAAVATLLGGLVLPAFAQQSNLPLLTDLVVLGGHVIYADTQTGASGVLVRLRGSGGAAMREAVTDSRGRFEFRNLAQAAYVVEVAHEGYEEVRVDVMVDFASSSHGTLMQLRRKSLAVKTAPGQTVSARELQVPDEARQAFERGLRELHERNEPKQSIPHFLHAIELHPAYDQAYVELALAYVESSEYGKAEKALEAATAVNPKNPQAYTLLGIIWRNQGQTGKSEEALAQALQLDPAAWLAHVELGKVRLAAGRLEEAERHARQAHTLNTHAPSVHLFLYNVSVRRAEYETALHELEEFLELHPDHPLAPQVQTQREELQKFLAASVN